MARFMALGESWIPRLTPHCVNFVADIKVKKYLFF